MRAVAFSVVVTAFAACIAGTGTAVAAPCQDPVVLVHDMARGVDEWNVVSAELQATGRCVDAVEYTYDAVLALEKPVIDPVCGGCRQLITGSEFLTDLRANGLRTDGVRYTDIVSDTDGLVVPPRSAEVRASDTVVIQDVDAGNQTHHFGLTTDPVVVRIAIGALE